MTSAPTCARQAKVLPLVERQISKRVSIVELSCQLSMICVADIASAVRLDGAARGLVVRLVVAEAVLEKGEAVTALAARMR